MQQALSQHMANCSLQPRHRLSQLPDGSWILTAWDGDAGTRKENRYVEEPANTSNASDLHDLLITLFVLLSRRLDFKIGSAS